ncbi:glycosyltransferase family 4 protein [Phaeodactylibacter xiamenensis]|uniref:glycosyltransferase family 4 protein n=1 Tax=Phaeodactylibacter xiamenensis TaxID=1524460 RepID=UPI0024A7C6EC|nr:glycosyltransferase family 4 protein [Phaeodactylibacter xiamenensis]
MKIIYFYQYYTTPEGSYGTRVHEFCKEWVKRGHEVTVITSVYYKSDLRNKELKFIDNLEYDGVKVKVLNILISNKQKVLQRVLTFFTYSILSIWYAITMPADVVVASSGPITVGIPGLAAKYIRKRKFVLEVRDLWPEVVVGLGIMKNGLAIKLAYWFERTCYKASDLVVGLSPGMAQWVKEKHGHTNCISITNAADNNLFGGDKDRSILPSWVQTKNYALYTGNIGEVNNSYLLFNTAKLIKEKGINDILIILIGDGQQKEELELKSKEEGLGNILIFLGLIPKKALAEWVKNALASVIPLKGVKVLDTSSPNKLFDSFAAGVPVIQNTNGWIKEELAKYGSGYTIPSDDPNKLLECLIQLRDDPSLVSYLGEKGKMRATSFFDKKILAGKMLDAIYSITR